MRAPITPHAGREPPCRQVTCALGRPGVGVHAHRTCGLATADLLGTMALAVLAVGRPLAAFCQALDQAQALEGAGDDDGLPMAAVTRDVEVLAIEAGGDIFFNEFWCWEHDGAFKNGNGPGDVTG